MSQRYLEQIVYDEIPDRLNRFVPLRYVAVMLQPLIVLLNIKYNLSYLKMHAKHQKGMKHDETLDLCPIPTIFAHVYCFSQDFYVFFIGAYKEY